MPDEDAVDGPPEATARPQTFTRDLEDTRRALESWLAARRPDATSVRIPELNIPATNGMSTETLLFDAVFDEEGTERTEPLVARVAPDPVNVPVFREYDLEGQFQIMRQVALHTSVPVPRVHWLERDPGVLGAPFFVMEKRYGIVPPDLMPYPFGGNWLFDAPRDQQAELQNATIEVIAELHGIEAPEQKFPYPRSRPTRAQRVRASRRRLDRVLRVDRGRRAPIAAPRARARRDPGSMAQARKHGRVQLG